MNVCRRFFLKYCRYYCLGELSLLVQWEIFRREKIGPRLSRKERERHKDRVAKFAGNGK